MSSFSAMIQNLISLHYQQGNYGHAIVQVARQKSHHPRGWIKRTRRGVEGEAPGLTSEYEIIQIIGR